jgi:hypothetical protein
MKVSRYAAPSIALLMLVFASSFAAGQTMQRSMVYRVQPSQPVAPQTTPTQAASRESIPASKQVSVGKRDVPNAQPRVAKISYVTSGTVKRASSVTSAAPHSNANAGSTVVTLQPAVTKTAIERTTAAKHIDAKATVAVPAHLRMNGRDVPGKKRFDKWFLASSAVFAVGAVLDHQSTVAGMKKAGARELNPLLRNSDGSFSPGKHLALTAGVYGASLMLQRKHPKMANVLRFIGGAAKIGVSIHNRSAARGR